jgi:hypothetical protein
MSSSSKTSSSPEISPEVAAEIARLMRDPDSMRAEAEHMRRSIGGGHYDPNQPRVPAGDPKGGQFASKGYRGGGSRASLDGAQFAQLGSGNTGSAGAQAQPFQGQVGEIGAGQHLNSQNGFIRTDKDPRRNRRMQDFETADERFRSALKDRLRLNKFPAALGGLSHRPHMPTTGPSARTPQFRQLLRVQCSSHTPTAGSSSGRSMADECSCHSDFSDSIINGVSRWVIRQDCASRGPPFEDC